MVKPMKTLLSCVFLCYRFLNMVLCETETQKVSGTGENICRYAPTRVVCPERSLIRSGEIGLCNAETDYMNKRYSLHILKNLMTFLQKCDISGLNVSKYIHEVNTVPPAIGISLSGGGYRSLLLSAGVMQQMDKLELLPCINYVTSVSGGTWLLAKLILEEFEDLQLATWDFRRSLLEGVSNFELSDEDVGDTDLISYKPWLNDNDSEHSSNLNTALQKRGFSNQYKILKIKLDSFINSFTFANHENSTINGSVTDMVYFMNFLDDLTTLQKTLHFYESIHAELKEKRLLGFPLSFTDYWGRALSKRMRKSLNKFDGSEEHTSSSVGKLHELTVKKSKKFKEAGMPFSIIVANCKNNPQMSNVVFEFSPFEFGSFHRSLNKFVEIEYLGSRIENGKSFECFTGFDDLGFISATSSSLFNNVLAVVWEMVHNCSKETFQAMSTILGSFGLNVEHAHLSSNEKPSDTKMKPDYAVFHPNPFYVSNDTESKDNSLTGKNYLYLVDGGEDGENVPLRPLLRAERRMDIIFAVDSSSDAKSWPNGKNMYNLFVNMQAENNTRTIKWKNIVIDVLNIPRIPKSITDRSKPMVFGCTVEKYIYSIKNKDVENKSTSKFLPPMIVYIPNFAHVFPSNTSTFKTQYNETEVRKMMQNGRAMLLSETADLQEAAHFQKCLACLIIKRSFDNGIAFGNPPIFCNTCYKEYCYN